MVYALTYLPKPCIDKGKLAVMPLKLSFVELKQKNVCPKSIIQVTSSSFVGLIK